MLPRAEAYYLIKELSVEEEIFFSPQPHQTHTRHILVSPQLEEVHEFIAGVVSDLVNNPKWAEIQKKYIIQANTHIKAK